MEHYYKIAKLFYKQRSIQSNSKNLYYKILLFSRTTNSNKRLKYNIQTRFLGLLHFSPLSPWQGILC